MKFINIPFFFSALFLFIQSCSNTRGTTENQSKKNSTFSNEISFLREYTEIAVLTDQSGKNKIAVAPALQGRVMTSTTSGGAENFGWINKELFASGDTLEHMNPFGGEDRIWLGPEGGQYSIYFEEGAAFTLDNWQVPRLLDLEPFDILSQNQHEITFSKDAELVNYSGTPFKFNIKRKISVLERGEAVKKLGISIPEAINFVAYESVNSLKNTGTERWKKENGLLSIWILGMFNPSEGTTIIIPFNNDNGQDQSTIVSDDYFGKVPPQNLKIGEKNVYFKGDGQLRSKIGLSWDRAKDILGSYDSQNNILTVVKYNKPNQPQDYVNSAWEIQEAPYSGDVINAYNDGPPAPGAKPLGPFYELETSSPAKELSPGDSIVHIHSTFHFTGEREQVDNLMQQLFGVPAEETKQVF